MSPVMTAGRLSDPLDDGAYRRSHRGATAGSGKRGPYEAGPLMIRVIEIVVLHRSARAHYPTFSGEDQTGRVAWRLRVRSPASCHR